MPEENKKENFTFSDKIKDSKTAASKSFANRVSSRIGRDGKPKQTILERTKRDAPFLIAALVALLLLPFLYKYSGSVSEEAVVTPSSSATVFDPERYAFAPEVEDPEGEISQLTARDPLDLIKGWGSDEEKYAASDEEYLGLGDSEDESLYRQRDAYAESAAASARKSATDTNVDIEENTTNIYKKRAVAGARHSFKRAATKINQLGPATLNPRSGNKLPGIWGGSLAKAAKKVGGPQTKDSPKPVSLQPLQAAGKPSRSAFGNPAAAMRQAKDALGKKDAQKAILDAQVKPVEPGSFGGMTFGDNKFGSGGSGKLDRKFNYTPQTPWWWDLLKTRSQAIWQHEMDRKWQWEGWMDKLAQNILGRLINCLVTGDDGGSVEHFLGQAKGTVTAATCCGKKESYFSQYEIAREGGFKNFCNGSKKDELKKAGLDCEKGFDPGEKASAGMNFFQVRAHCLGIGFGGGKYSGEDDTYKCDCEDGGRHFVVKSYGEAKKWANKGNVYHWVVARNKKLNFGNKQIPLCNVHSDNLFFGPSKGLGGTQDNQETAIQDGEGGHNVAVGSEYKQENQNYSTKKDNKQDYKKYNAVDDYGDEGCVIYLAQGDTFMESDMKEAVHEVLANLAAQYGACPTAEDIKCRELAREVYPQIDFMFVGGGVMKDKLGNGGKDIKNRRSKGHLLPSTMLYYRFQQSYLNRVNIRLNGEKDDILHNNPLRGNNEVFLCGEKCSYTPELSARCLRDSVPPQLEVSIQKGSKVTTEAINIEVVFKQEGKTFKGTVEPYGESRNPLMFTATPEAPESEDAESFTAGTVEWTVNYNGKVRREICPAVFDAEPTPSQGETIVTNQREEKKDEPPPTHQCDEFDTNVLLVEELSPEAAAYMQRYKEKPTEGYTVGDVAEIVWQQNRQGTIPSNLVCVTAKTIGHASRDKQAPQSAECPFDNIFGSVFAYMGLDAASFPSQYTHHICQQYANIDNLRFPANSKYWWGGYVDDRQPGAEGKGKRVQEFREGGVNYWTKDGKFPLAGLIRTPFPTDGEYLVKPQNYNGQGSLENYYRNEFHRMYADFEDGNIKCHYAANATLNISDVADYLDLLCEHGSFHKPEAMFNAQEFKEIQRKRWAAYCKEHPQKCKNNKRKSGVKRTVRQRPQKRCYGNNDSYCQTN